MPSNSLQPLLNRLSSVYNKFQGTTSSMATTIAIPSPINPLLPSLEIGTSNLTQGSSNNVKLLDSVGFTMDLMLQNIQTVQDISYVGQVPVVITGQLAAGTYPLFSSALEYNNLPGNIFNVNQTAANVVYTIPIPANTNSITYIIIVNTGTTSFSCYNVVIPAGGYQVYGYSPSYTTWIALGVTGYNTTTNSLITANPVNAVNVPGAFTVDLDSDGKNYGVPRIVTEDDLTYKKRISNSLTGAKITPTGIINQFREVYGVAAQVYQWFPSSYPNLIALLQANPGFEAFYLDGSAAPGLTTGPLDPTKSQGYYGMFYVVVPSSIILSFPNGVYPNLLGTTPDWTFADHESVSIGPGLNENGGFFVPNFGEAGFSPGTGLNRYLYLISAIKAAGTSALLIVLP